MIASHRARALRLAESGVLSLLVLFFCIHTLPRAWRTLNTDFPNYYTAVHLAHEGFDTSRIYDWLWLQRQKDHRAIDIPVIGLVPITPFSTLAVWPLTHLAPLSAKHVWTILNFALLVPLCALLRSLTGLHYRRIALILALSFPLHRNILYGQFYLVLLLLIVTACLLYIEGFRASAGIFVALAVACKIFPLVFLAFFGRRRDWRALIAAGITLIATTAISIAVFGLNVHRTYLFEVLPWTLHGEALPPYATASTSISSVLHYLFLFEPQWNPHPWHNSPLAYALLLPSLQVLLFAPAVLLIRKQRVAPCRTLLEWSALLTASLTVSTIPASYNFVLLVLPVCVLAEHLLSRRKHICLALLILTYTGIGLPIPSPHRYVGPAILLFVPRLPLLIALLIGIYIILWRDPNDVARTHDSAPPSRDRTRYAWIALFAAALIFSVHSTLHRERAMRQEFVHRLPLQTDAFLSATPQPAGVVLYSIALTMRGYRLAANAEDSGKSLPVPPSSADQLSFAATPSHTFIEYAGSPLSVIAEIPNYGAEDSRVIVDNARQPTLSADNQTLAFIRDDHGRGRLIARSLVSNNFTETSLTPPALNVYEVSFISSTLYALAAAERGHAPQLYLTDASHSNAPLSLGEARYPALSPDHHWMAFSRFNNGVWNLWLRDQLTGGVRRIADVPCNQIQPAWESDSSTLFYGTDCGRSLWYTAIARRKVIP